MRLLDLAVILAYLVAIAAIGLRLSGRQASATAYFVGERDMPWWAVCFSIVATETSTLTVISVPGVAYMGAFGFVELAIGYLIGRSLVAAILLPLYMRGGFISIYQYLRERFGGGMQRIASVTFLLTRLLAEGCVCSPPPSRSSCCSTPSACPPATSPSSRCSRWSPCSTPTPAASAR